MNKLRTARLLMSATILVIIFFQAYWIRKLYAEEEGNFRKNTDLIFKETMYRLQAERFVSDTLVFKDIPGDNLFMSDVISSVKKINIIKDSSARPKLVISMNTEYNPKTGVISRRYSNRKSDSLSRSGKDTVAYTDDKRSKPQLRIEKFLQHNKTLNDTIAVQRIDSLYKIMLAKEGITTPYKILRADPVITNDSNQQQVMIRVTDDSIPTNIFATRRIPVGLMQPTFYRAEFTSPAMYLVKKISMPVLIAVLLIALTALSFIFIYRNLVAQRRLTAIKNEFIGNITHELKTPIATVSVAIEAMKNFNALQNPERTQEYLGIAGQELNRLSLLVDKVLRLSMFETQQLELKYEWFDMDTLVKDVLSSMQLQFEKHHADIQLHLSGDDFSIMADQLHITSVVYNLLDNALKYSKGKPEIDIAVESAPASIILTVQDNGIGIPASYKEKIFDKFFRVPHGDKHNVKGYGLGLSYVAHIIQQHKGQVEVQSEEGKGTTFIIKLPKENAG